MSVKFLLDENTPYALIEFLESRGFTVKHLKKLGKAGIKNGEVYKLAEKNKMWIVTRDADFQNLRRFSAHKIAGIILFKLSVSKTENLLKAMSLLLDKHQKKLLKKHLIIVEDYEIKIH